MRYFLTFILIMLANQSLANSVSFLGTNSSGNGVFLITNTALGTERYSLTIGSTVQEFDGLAVGTNIVEFNSSVADGASVILKEQGITLATATVSDASTEFVMHTSANETVTSISSPLLLDAIKQNYDTNSTNATAIANNTAAIARNTKKIADNATGVAEAMAIGVMQFDLSYDGLQTSLGGASFNGTDGFAFMAGKNIQDNVFTSFSATSTGNYAGGVTIKW
jgi:hypothetical protein